MTLLTFIYTTCIAAIVSFMSSIFLKKVDHKYEYTKDKVKRKLDCLLLIENIIIDIEPINENYIGGQDTHKIFDNEDKLNKLLIKINEVRLNHNFISKTTYDEILKLYKIIKNSIEFINNSDNTAESYEINFNETNNLIKNLRKNLDIDYKKIDKINNS